MSLFDREKNEKNKKVAADLVKTWGEDNSEHNAKFRRKDSIYPNGFLGPDQNDYCVDGAYFKIAKGTDFIRIFDSSLEEKNMVQNILLTLEEKNMVQHILLTLEEKNNV